MSGWRGVVASALFGVGIGTGAWFMRSAEAEPVAVADGAQLFDAVRREIQRKYVEPVDDTVLYRKAVDGLLQELGDPHSGYLPPARFRQLTERATGNYAGIGARVDTRDGWPTIIAPIPGSPADEAALATGDRIVEIEGKATRGWSTEETVRAIRGPAGSRIRFVVERPDVPGRRALDLVRRDIHVQAVGRATMVAPTVGYVDLDEFSDSAATEVAAAIDRLRGQGARGIVLDLRGNPGGLLEQGVSVAQLFLRRGQKVVALRGRAPGMTREIEVPEDGRYRDVPVAVLVNEGSASAAEIVAGALQDHDRALVLGAPTFGKGSAQSVFPFGEGALKLTTARWYTPLGRSISRVTRPARDAEVVAEPGADGEAAADSAPRVPFRTAAGRTVFGGDAIVPDLIVRDTLHTALARDLDEALAGKVGAFRDALTAAALEFRRTGQVKSPDEPVTEAMVAKLRAVAAARGLTVPDDIWTATRPVVDRLLGVEMARFAFGPDGVFARTSRTDPVLQQAIRRLEGVRSAAELFAPSIAGTGEP